MVEYEQIMTLYEFEDAANFFADSVAELSKNFPDLIVESENKTLSDLEANSWAIQKSASLNKLEMNRRAFLRGYEMDIKSANETDIMVTVHGSQKRNVRKFESLVEKSAKFFGGVRINGCDTKDFDGPEGEHGLFIALIYAFR